MYKKALTATVAALTMATASLITAPAHAGSLGKFIAAGIFGAVVGSAIISRSAQADQPSYGYRPIRGSYNGGYEGCGFRNSPIFDQHGDRIGSHQVPAC